MNKENNNIKKNNKLFIIIIVILLIILCIAVSMIYIKKEPESPVNENKTTTTEEVLHEAVDLTNTKNVKIENKVKNNTSKKLNKKHNFTTMTGDIITIDNISLIGDGNTGNTTFKFDIISPIDIEVKSMALRFIDNDGNIINGYEVTIDNIIANESKTITFNFRDDFSNAYDFQMQM